MNANGDIRNKISRGARARGPVMMRFVTTVCHSSISFSCHIEGRGKGREITLIAANITPNKVRINPITVK